MPLRPSAMTDADRAHLREASRALESLIVKQLITASKAFTGGEGAGSAIRADMFAETLADAMVKGGGIGLARQIERSVLPDPAGPTATSPLTPGGRQASLSPAGGEGGHAAPRVTSPFGLRHDPFDGHLTRHAGVDLAAKEGEDIPAAAGGVVVHAGARGGYGDAVEIDHGGGVTTLYAHASEVLVREGEEVSPGQSIARVGQTGRATGSHLHFELREGGRPVDPSRALKNYRLRADDPIRSGS
ncbi:MAG TPA: peptidoglycan DD-metalloendopeptidase family protein [Anaeromyxobacteraceae bacterium]